MTITTEPTTTAEVPARLNLDAIVPAATVENIAQALDYARRNLDTIRTVSFGIRTWVREIEELVRDLPDDVGQAVLVATGVSELHQLGSDLAHLFETAADCTAGDQNVLERLDDISLTYGATFEVQP